MDYTGSRGYDAYLLDLRRYGKSIRPSEMAENANANPPIMRGSTQSRTFPLSSTPNHQTAQYPKAESDRLVLGCHAGWGLYVA
jgi:hypothetical protein